MLRGPVATSFPSLDALPREAGTSGHVYPFSARSVSPMSQMDPLRLPSSIASATFWRSPYSEALRQTKPSVPRRAEGHHSTRDSSRTSGQDVGEKKSEEGDRACDGGVATDSQKNQASSEGKDSGSDVSGGDNAQQLRGILCKSSLSSSSRQSGAKVQKRVKFDDSVDKGQSPRQSQSAICGRTPPRQDPQPPPNRSLSASLTAKSSLRMPSLRPPGDRQPEDKSYPPQSPSPSPTLLPNPRQYPHIPKSSAGSLIQTSSMSELTLPRAVPKGGSQGSYQLVAGPYSVHSCPSPGPGSTSSRLSPTPLDFKVYRQPLASPSGRASESGQSPPPPPPPAHNNNRGRFFATPGHRTSTRSLERLSRSFTSPAITLPRPVKRPVPSSSSNDDLPLTPPASGAGVHPDSAEKALTARDVVQAIQADKAAGRRESFLDNDKTVQILHWLQEVGHRQAREGRCPVFVGAACRDV
ncbi:uncharacterized protein LOC143293719 [Babylonia areolata]|uniref:uncharacterized protein LOC143293719 n=1 Tax=Babylonia areolata TaxID=304850 RepID=UPI003FD6B9C8